MRRAAVAVMSMAMALWGVGCLPPPPGPQACSYIVTGTPTQSECTSTLPQVGITVNNALLFPIGHCTYEFTVNWRDGSPAEPMELSVETTGGEYQFFTARHTYEQPGEYAIGVTGIGDALLCPQVHRTLEFTYLGT